MAYVPENKYKILYTNGGEFRIANTTKPYIGKYIRLTNGKIFAGDDLNNHKGHLVPLVISRTNNVKPGRNNKIYNRLQPNLSNAQNNYVPIPSHNPTPNALDYSKGYFARYFSVRLNTKQYQEISKQTYENFETAKNDGNLLYNTSLNRVFQLDWDLSEDNELINAKTLRKLNYQLPGLFNFFPDKGQFAIKYGVVNIGPTNRIYPTGEAVPRQLPKAYQTGNQKVNSIDNPNVPQFQHCGNCKFNQNGYCTAWNAQIRNNYWCAVWQGLGSEE